MPLTNLSQHAERNKRPDSVRDDKAMIETIILPALSGLKVAEVTHRDVAALHASLKATPYCANRVLSLLSKVMNLAVQPERMRPDNPAKGVARFHEERRERWLSTDELRRLVATWVWRSSRPTISSDSPDETKVRGVGVPEIVQPHDEALRPPRRQPLREATERFGAMVGSPRLR